MDNWLFILTYILFTIIIGAVAIYWYLAKDLKYWEKVGIPHEKGVLLLGSYGKVFKNPTHIVELERYKKYGRLYGAYEGRRPVLYIADPDLLRDVLVKDFHVFPNHRDMVFGDPVGDNMLPITMDEKWKRIRTLVTPAFTTGKMKKMVKTILESAKTLKKNLEKLEKTGEPFNIKRMFGAFTMDVIASCAFATKIDSHNDPDNEFVVNARRHFSRNISWRFAMTLLLPQVMRLFNISAMTPEVINFFRTITLQIIEQRKKTGQKGNDFLQLLIDAAENQTDEEESEETNTADREAKKIALEYGHEETHNQTFSVDSKKKYKYLSNDEVVAQCIVFFFAGYDSVSSTLSFITYNLSQNPDIQEKLISEIDDTIAKHKGELNYTAIQEMKYLDLVIRETMRLFPQGIRLERAAKEEYKLGNTGITIPKGFLIYVPVYGIHHDPEFYPDPEKFNPERFLSEVKAQRHAYTYLPFGAGPRNCIGMRIALMEIKVCIAYLLTHFRFKDSGLESPIEFFTGTILLGPKHIMVCIETRNDKKADL